MFLMSRLTAVGKWKSKKGLREGKGVYEHGKDGWIDCWMRSSIVVGG